MEVSLGLTDGEGHGARADGIGLFGTALGSG
jgi:hypothetical protein